MSDGNIIAIDGPVASGKGTVAKELSKIYNGFHFSTGLVYRCIGLYCKSKNIDLKNEKEIVSAIENVRITISKEKVLLNNKDVSTIVYKDSVGDLASKVSVHKKVRQHAVTLQRKILKKASSTYPFVVVEGRDTGTVLAPNAKLKIFLTSDLNARSKRRHEQISQNSDVNIQDIIRSVKERDHRDTTRKHSPLVKNPQKHGYKTIDNTEQTINQTIEAVANEMKNLKII